MTKDGKLLTKSHPQPWRPRGGTGRRKRLKIARSQGRAGSIPAGATNFPFTTVQNSSCVSADPLKNMKQGYWRKTEFRKDPLVFLMGGTVCILFTSIIISTIMWPLNFTASMIGQVAALTSLSTFYEGARRYVRFYEQYGWGINLLPDELQSRERLKFIQGNAEFMQDLNA